MTTGSGSSRTRDSESAQRLRLAVTVVIVLSVIGIAGGLLFSRGEGLSAGDVGLLLVPATVGLLIVALVFRPRAGRGRPPVSVEPGVQDAVVRALDNGGTTDPRIDALARQNAEWETGRGWFIGLTGAGAALQAGAAVFRAVVDDNWFQVGLSVLLAVCFGLTCWTAVKGRRRALRYLAGG
ncbi:hypothetical protein [Paractinoplanes maris]|uniref:hypothetical protein n=1 Tax=Paractinoplanes maris TaxID=1734446 RepID=UPI002021BA14|nr:hypothetical protein [Actinoplanes maris]